MINTLERIISQIDKIGEKVDSIDRTMIKQEENLKEHMRRTEILEKQHDALYKQLHDELKPVKTHISQVKGISKFILALVAVSGAIIGVMANI